MKSKEWLKAMCKKIKPNKKQLNDESDVNKTTIENTGHSRKQDFEKTRKAIDEYFKAKDKGTFKLSYDCEDLIEEIRQDIEEFGENHECILIYKVIDGAFIFTNYDFITDEEPFNPEKELSDNEYYIIATFKYALDVFEKQNTII